jgi:hypothetical protein
MASNRRREDKVFMGAWWAGVNGRNLSFFCDEKCTKAFEQLVMRGATR